jgi:hypothetical protein
MSQVGCHHCCSAAQKGERGGEHPRVADRDQEGKPGLALFLDDGDRVLTRGVEAEFPVLFAGNLSRSALPAAMRSPTGGRGVMNLSSKAEGVWSSVAVRSSASPFTSSIGIGLSFFSTIILSRNPGCRFNSNWHYFHLLPVKFKVRSNSR